MKTEATLNSDRHREMALKTGRCFSCKAKAVTKYYCVVHRDRHNIRQKQSRARVDLRNKHGE